MKHTSGPWVLGTRDHSTYDITGPKGSLPYIAHVPSGRDNRSANARLIAAAPDLLAALKVAEKAMQADISGIDIGASFEQIRAAIAKATGE